VTGLEDAASASHTSYRSVLVRLLIKIKNHKKTCDMLRSSWCCTHQTAACKHGTIYLQVHIDIHADVYTQVGGKNYDR
jgi:hypothetical protein